MSIMSKMCEHSDISKKPSHGVEDSKTRKFCSQHAKQGMVKVISNRYLHPTCNKQPAFGVEGT